MSPTAGTDGPTRRCPKCSGGVTNPAADDGRAVQWHIDNCLYGEDVHVALHMLLGADTCCEAEDHCDA